MIQETEGVYLSESLVNYSGAWLSYRTLKASLSYEWPLIIPPADSHGSINIPPWSRGIALLLPLALTYVAVLSETALWNFAMYSFKSHQFVSFKTSETTEGLLITLPTHPLPQCTGAGACNYSWCSVLSLLACKKQLGGKGKIKEGRSPLWLIIN